MARAKRTDRTEARRRYRAELAATAGDESAEETAEPAVTSRSSSKRGAPSDKAAPTPRPSIMAAFRGAGRPLDLRGDLMALPQVLTSWGLLAAIGGTIAAAVWFAEAYGPGMAALPAGTATSDQIQAVVGANTIPYFVLTMAVQPPPIIGAFLIGFAAKRASYLGGLMYGIVVTVVAMLLVQTDAGRILTLDGPTGPVILGHASISPVGAAVFAAAAAWYRRFLDLSNPNRGRRPPAKSGQGGRSTRQKAAR